MKKVLFATTALIATASVAAADVSFSGYGRFGVIYTDTDGTAAVAASAGYAAAADAVVAAQAALNAAATVAAQTAAQAALDAANTALAAETAPAGAVAGTSVTDVTSRIRLQIDMTAESDAGVTFGARVRIQQNETDAIGEAANSGTGINGARFYAKTGGLEVGVGNIYGALEFMPGQYPIDLGLTGLGYDYTAYNFRGDAYSSGGAGAAGNNGVEVIYAMGDFKVHASASNTNDRRAIVGTYNYNNLRFELGFQDSNAADDTEATASIGGNIGPADVTLTWADNGTAGEHIVLAGRFDVGASTDIEAYYADADSFADDDSYGIDFNHDLGGGTSLRGGITKRGSGATQADLGVRFNF